MGGSCAHQMSRGLNDLTHHVIWQPTPPGFGTATIIHQRTHRKVGVEQEDAT